MKFVTEMNHYYYKMALYELQIMNENDYYKGLSYNSILYINVISQIENCTASKVAELLNITKSAVTLKLNELVKQGAIVKSQSEDDKRVFYIRLSSEMEQNLNIYSQVLHETEANLYKKYSKEQIELFTEILHTVSSYEWRKKNE